MKRRSILKLSILGAFAAATVGTAAVTASAQTATTSSSPGVLTTSSTATSTTSVKKKPTSATADMVNEAIQRSQARAAKERANGTPQQWGSEEPFVYNPAVKNFTSQQQ
jgi:hypothetical protein